MYIYTITSLKKHDIGDGLNRLVYVGSCNDYEKRFITHKSNCFNPKATSYNSKVYKLIREIGWDNFVCEVVEVMSDDTTDEELLKMEQNYIDKFESKKSMNTNDAFGYDVKKYQKKYGVEYRTKNRDILNDLKKNRYLLKVTFRAFCNISIYE